MAAGPGLLVQHHDAGGGTGLLDGARRGQPDDARSHDDDVCPVHEPDIVTRAVPGPEGPGGEAAMIWTLRPEMAGMVDRMITTAYRRSTLPAAEREVARMRVAQMNDCSACATFRAGSVLEAGVPPTCTSASTSRPPGYTEQLLRRRPLSGGPPS